MIMGSNSYTSAFVAPGVTTIVPGIARLTEESNIPVFQKK